MLLLDLAGGKLPCRDLSKNFYRCCKVNWWEIEWLEKMGLEILLKSFEFGNLLHSDYQQKKIFSTQHWVSIYMVIMNHLEVHKSVLWITISFHLKNLKIFMNRKKYLNLNSEPFINKQLITFKSASESFDKQKRDVKLEFNWALIKSYTIRTSHTFNSINKPHYRWIKKF